MVPAQICEFFPGPACNFSHLPFTLFPNTLAQQSTTAYFNTSISLADCKNATPTHLNMDTYSGGEGDDFLARRGVIREPLRGLPYTFAGSHPRVVAGLINGELDNLVREAFDCGDADDTFRGMLRAAIDRIQPDVVTSLCAYCIGFEGNSTELSLLVTVVPGSLTPSEAIQAIVELSAVLER